MFSPQVEPCCMSAAHGQECDCATRDVLTIRDRFAIAAMNGILAADDSITWFSVVAKDAYEMADAMLAAREGKE